MYVIVYCWFKELKQNNDQENSIKLNLIDDCIDISS